ncbi:hypothetical protein [Campylobacter concisus]|uniref:hypothetical protein n=1 Tax=Campylobacter concisus TaxID=199 RepID=UPI001CA5D751|nr:hypothetical protein [Campylobacter concisus]
MSSASPCSCRSIVGIAGRYTSVDSDVHAISALSTTKKDSEVFEEFKFPFCCYLSGRRVCATGDWKL